MRDEEDAASNGSSSHTHRPAGTSTPSWPFYTPQTGASSNGSSSSMTTGFNRPSPSHIPAAPYGPSEPPSIFGSAAPREDVPMDGGSHESAKQVPFAILQALQRAPTLSTRLSRQKIPKVEKDADDPTSPPTSTRRESTNLNTLSRLFAVQAASSPEGSRHASYMSQPPRYSGLYSRSIQSAEVAALPDHLYNRGLLSGRHSDITVNAFGQQYRLHRLILDRAPFFLSALSEPWLEASTKEMTVHPEDIDSAITQAAFEMALKRLYGSCNPADEDQDPVGLFATGCWLEMHDLIECSIESMLRQMTPETLSPLIRLVTNNYYGRAGDKILASAKSMLCRDGWNMQLRFWDGIPGDIVREIVGGDGFYIDGEFDRWVLAKRILDRRLRKQAASAGLMEPGSRRRPMKVPDAANLMAVRFDTVYRKNSVGTGRGMPDSLHKWIALYTSPEVEPLLVLLDEGIHYLHLDFEQLQYIRNARDSLGLPVMSEKVVSNALWQQMELRQRITNAREAELELGVSIQCNEDSAVGLGRDTTMSIATPSEPQNARDKRRAVESEEASVDDDIDSGSWDGNGKPRKFWIPQSDCNIVMGGNAEGCLIATSNTTTMQRHATRLSATIQPEDVQWVSDFTAATSQPRPATGDGAMPNQLEPASVSYSHFPPFRFAAEFPNPRSLKEKKRVYSRTVFYAGSLWNIYIQKVNSSRSKQLGVYLHRAKERETEEVIAGTAGLAQGSVDERIGQLEREMISRSERRERRRTNRRANVGLDGTELDGAESSGSAGDNDYVGRSREGAEASAETMRTVLARGHKQADMPESSAAGTSGSLFTRDDDEAPDTDSESEGSETERLAAASKRFHVPTLPPYVDARPTIKTYFKIYSPSRGGRMLSVYESAPDKFNFSQSWGWKSSTLMLDEGLGDEMEDVLPHDPEAGNGEGHVPRRPMKERGDGKLRFMVVIGNI